MAQQRERTENYTPVDFTDAYRTFYDYVVTLVQKFGIRREDAEDVASYIWTRFHTREALEYYDPNHDAAVVFKSFLYGFTHSYIQHFRDKQARRQHVEGLSINLTFQSQLSNGSAYGSDVSWLDVKVGGTGEEAYESAEWRMMQPLIRKRLAEYSGKKMRSKEFSLVLLYDLVLIQYDERGYINLTELAELFGVRLGAISSWMEILRAELREALEG